MSSHSQQFSEALPDFIFFNTSFADSNEGKDLKKLLADTGAVAEVLLRNAPLRFGPVVSDSCAVAGRTPDSQRLTQFVVDESSQTFHPLIHQLLSGEKSGAVSTKQMRVVSEWLQLLPKPCLIVADTHSVDNPLFEVIDKTPQKYSKIVVSGSKWQPSMTEARLRAEQQSLTLLDFVQCPHPLARTMPPAFASVRPFGGGRDRRRGGGLRRGRCLQRGRGLRQRGRGLRQRGCVRRRGRGGVAPGFQPPAFEEMDDRWAQEIQRRTEILRIQRLGIEETMRRLKSEEQDLLPDFRVPYDAHYASFPLPYAPPLPLPPTSQFHSQFAASGFQPLETEMTEERKRQLLKGPVIGSDTAMLEREFYSQFADSGFQSLETEIIEECKRQTDKTVVAIDSDEADLPSQKVEFYSQFAESGFQPLETEMTEGCKRRTLKGPVFGSDTSMLEREFYSQFAESGFQPLETEMTEECKRQTDKTVVAIDSDEDVSQKEEESDDYCEEMVPLFDFSLKTTHLTALCIAPSADSAVIAELNAVRSKYDPAFPRWLPHINVIYPFYESLHFGAFKRFAKAQLRDKRVAFDGPLALKLGLSKATTFPQSGGQTNIHLRALSHERVLGDVYSALAKAGSRRFQAHLTVAKVHSARVCDLFADELLPKWGPQTQGVTFKVTELLMISREEKPKQPFKIIDRISLLKDE